MLTNQISSDKKQIEKMYKKLNKTIVCDSFLEDDYYDNFSIFD